MKPYIVGIAGGSASGKTSFIQALQRYFTKEKLALVSQDNYYLPMQLQRVDGNGKTNFDLPESIDRESFYLDMTKLIRGESIIRDEYTFNMGNDTSSLITIQPAPIVIMEGLFIFHYKEISDLLDLKVFIEAKPEIKLKRRLERDLKERGYPKEDILYQWDNHVIPSYEKYLLPYRDDSHLIITNNRSFEKGLDVLTDHLEARLK